VQLINASDFYKNTKIKLGEKNKEITNENISMIYKTFLDFDETEYSKIFSNNHFGYTEITIDSPILKNGDLEYDSKGKIKIDTSLKSKEKVPLTFDINDFLEKEIIPFSPHSLSERKNDAIGYEIEFNKEFYKFKSFRDLDSIKTEIDTLEKEIKKLNEEL